MKSERRHKLQQNALAHSLENLPKMGKESGSKLLLGVVTVLLIVVLIWNYKKSREEKRQAVAAELADARFDLADLSGDHLMERGIESLAPDAHKKLLDDIKTKIDAVQAETTDAALLAQAKNIRADAYVQMAFLGNPPEATTRPELELSPPADQMLDEAARTYQEVLDTKEGLPPAEASDAHSGLAAIAENRKEWDKARSEYEAISKIAGMPKSLTDYAAFRLQVLDNKISKPFIVGKPMTRPSFDLSMLPKTNPTSLPATMPAGPASMPTAVEGPATVPVVPTTPPLAPLTAPTTVPTTGT